MNSITIKQFFENQIINKQAYAPLVRCKMYQLAVRDRCRKICADRGIKIEKLQITKTKSVYLFDESIIKEAISKETEAKNPRGKHVK
ncbi:MAG: hypothetical protein QJT81_16525 [Candidatus Thiothrix putei]|uniref:Uncharacterized protein n=1 Tax=Candidatus Thiothrix putei TaxID=3080811 RepID=A0AA95H9K6_9GAMM|nr:MAG: hypothetical protein QJT81_16525 [Candidatus Thiothrix putei]